MNRCPYCGFQHVGGGGTGASLVGVCMCGCTGPSLVGVSMFGPHCVANRRCTQRIIVMY